MKRAFTTNWYIYRVCSLSISTRKLQCDTSKEVATSPDFNKLLLKAIDEGLSSLGDPGKKAVYFYLEKTFKIKKQEIPKKIDEFANAIEEIFGYGAKFLEIQIMKHLYKKVGHDFECFPETDDLFFAEYVEAARY